MYIVWHSVSTDINRNQDENSDMFMIHGAGSYQSDFSYSEMEGIPVQQIPFYSPSLGKYCNDQDGECGFAAWVSSNRHAINRYSEQTLSLLGQKISNVLKHATLVSFYY